MNERLVVVVPAASYALCAGSAPLINEARGLSQLLYVSEAMEEGAKVCACNSTLKHVNPESALLWLHSAERLHAIGGRKRNNHLKICMNFLNAQWKSLQRLIMILVQRCCIFLLLSFLFLLPFELIHSLAFLLGAY